MLLNPYRPDCTKWAHGVSNTDSVFLSGSLMLTMHNFSNALLITLVRPHVNSSIRTKPKTCQRRSGGLSLW